MEHLALEVRGVDDVHVDDPDRADAGRGEVEGRRRAQPARAEQEDLRVEQPELALLADLGQQQVALVAVALVRAEGPGHLEVEPVVLPAVEPARHRHDVAVAELLEGPRRERRAHAGRAVDDDASGLVGQATLDVELELAPRDVHGAADRALVVLVGLADVEERGAAELGRRHRARRPP